VKYFFLFLLGLLALYINRNSVDTPTDKALFTAGGEKVVRSRRISDFNKPLNETSGINSLKNPTVTFPLNRVMEI